MGHGGMANGLPDVKQPVITRRVDVAGRVRDHIGQGLAGQVDADRLVIPERFRTEPEEAQPKAGQQSAQQGEAQPRRVRLSLRRGIGHVCMLA